MVDYQRAGGVHGAVMATVGATDFGVSEAGTGTVNWQSRDYLIDVADMLAAGIEGEPKRGDQIRERQGARTYVYEVLAPGGDTPWRYSDMYRRTFRIHTKHIATVIG